MNLVPEVRTKALELVNKNFSHDTGALAEFGKSSTGNGVESLSKYRRVFVYTQAIGLLQAVRLGNPKKANSMVAWLLENVVEFLDESGKKVKAGWYFSYNTQDDHWVDPRIITGANAWVLDSLGTYIKSELFPKTETPLATQIKGLYERTLFNILNHQREDGLFTAGWTVEPLLEVDPDKYYDILGEIGYEPEKFSRNKEHFVITEHNIDMLSVLNHAIRDFEKVSSYDRNTLLKRRNRLQNAIFSKLYDPSKKRFITAIDKNGIPSPFSAVDNTSWLSLAVNYQDLTPKEQEKLGNGLQFTTEKFVKQLPYKNDTYLGAHYFQAGFTDPYIPFVPGNCHEQVYHLEATLGLVLGLKKYSHSTCLSSISKEFEIVADKLWSHVPGFLLEARLTLRVSAN